MIYEDWPIEVLLDSINNQVLITGFEATGGPQHLQLYLSKQSSPSVVEIIQGFEQSESLSESRN